MVYAAKLSFLYLENLHGRTQNICHGYYFLEKKKMKEIFQVAEK